MTAGPVKSERLPDGEPIPYTVLPDGTVLVKCRFCDGTGHRWEDGSGLCEGCNGRGVQVVAKPAQREAHCTCGHAERWHANRIVARYTMARRECKIEDCHCSLYTAQ